MSFNKTEDRSKEPEVPAISHHPKRSVLLLIISLAGLVIALLSGFREDIPFVKSLCSTACSDAAEIRLLGLPLWFMGVVFYAGVALLALFEQGLAPWIVGPAVGVEAVLVWIMIQMKIPCVFCQVNAAVMLLLLAAAFRKRLFWQQATLALLFFVGFFFWGPFDNGSSRYAPVNAGRAAGVQRDDTTAIAATIGDEVITEQRLEVLLGSKLLETRREIYRMKKERLDQLIVEKILDKEAAQQAKTPEDLVEQIAPAASLQVPDAEIDMYLQDNRERLQEFKGSIEELRQRLRAFLEQQKRSQLMLGYARSLEPKYGVKIFLSVPNPLTVKVDTRGAPSQGPTGAPVTIVEFSDYQCPACRATHEVVKRVGEAYGDKIHWIFKDYPLRRHKEAFKAAEASYCAQEQGKFWEYRERLFSAPDLSPANLVNIAGELGMSREKFDLCLQESKYKALVEKNVQDAVATGIDRTPSFMVNGIVAAGGLSFEGFKGRIDEELKKAGQQLQVVDKTK
jgi:protein-disulfide isomerase